ncbi:MAG: stage II sporulation protein E [Firmicutes bacterium]|nr:stage II sporulation protein E [Bacillota bacterium]
MARAQVLGGLHPFAPAFLGAAMVVYPKRGAVYSIPVLCGYGAAVSGQAFFVYLSIVALLAIVFLLYGVDGKKQWFVTPGMVFSAVAVSKGLAIAISGFNSYALLTGIFEAIIAGGLTLVFLVIFNACRRFDIARRFSTDETICMFVAAAGGICGLSGWQIAGYDIQGVVSRLAILTAAYLGGAGPGAAVGSMLGVIPSLSAVVSPSLIAAYAFSGMLAGVFSAFGKLGTALGFLLGNLILALYFFSGEVISAQLLASLAAAVVFIAIPQKAYGFLLRAFSSTGLKSAQEEKNERLLHLAVRKLRNCGWLYRELSSSLADIGGEELLGEEDMMRATLDQLSHQLCGACSLRDICWELDYQDTFDGVLRLFGVIRRHGLAEVKDVPENFSKRCPHIKELVAILNCLYDMHCRDSFWQLQRISSRKLLAAQLSGAAQVMDKIAHEIVQFGDEREVLERELQRAVAKRGLPIESAGLISVNERTIDIWAQYVECPGELYCREAVAQEAARLTGKDFFVCEHRCGGKACQERCYYRLLAAGAHRLKIGQAQLARDSKGVCGDTGGSMLLEEGRHLLMVSDGMGIGEKAAQESGAALSLVSRLLEAGFMQDTAIDLVNAALSLRGNEESFVTMDLCIVDLYDCTAEFIKTGGSPSYIKRGSTVKSIKGDSLPVGMLYNVEKETVREHLLPGDFIILASDGLLDTDRKGDGAWLSRVIEEANYSDPQQMAEYLLNEVMGISCGKIKDDITILVARVGEAA